MAGWGGGVFVWGFLWFNQLFGFCVVSNWWIECFILWYKSILFNNWGLLIMWVFFLNIFGWINSWCNYTNLMMVDDHYTFIFLILKIPFFWNKKYFKLSRISTVSLFFTKNCICFQLLKNIFWVNRFTISMKLNSKDKKIMKIEFCKNLEFSFILFENWINSYSKQKNERPKTINIFFNWKILV